MLKAVIFDLDGVIADSMNLHFEAEKKTLLKYGISATTVELAAYSGNKVTVKFSEMLRKHGVKASPEDVLKVHVSESYEYIKLNVAPVQGAIKLLKELNRKKLKLCVASGSPRIFVEFVVDKFRIRGLFEFILTGDDVVNSKPDPEMFLKAAQKKGCKPNECIVMEDALNGIQAAKAAGMKCVAIATTHEKDELAAADKIIGSFSELSISDLKHL